MRALLLMMLSTVNNLHPQGAVSRRCVYVLELAHILMLTYNTETHGSRGGQCGPLF